MKTLAALLNIAVLGLAIYLTMKHGLPNSNEDWWMFWLMIAAPIASLIALFTGGSSKGWLSLYLQRKALEEQQKIEALRKP